MATLYTYPAPEVAAAMEASAAYQVKILASITGILGLCWILLGTFFLYHFCKPLKIIDSESTAELGIVKEVTEKRWWMDDCDAEEGVSRGSSEWNQIGQKKVLSISGDSEEGMVKEQRESG
ncbi:hypothetical protein GGR53DRAFT_289381 [Hypoxylon sp. FL1150]|nr:hypothetical protein GGR53DRAFT_289381 [Hypoxylon sp. FL1150]